MNEATHQPVTCQDHPVWIALSHYIVGPEDAALPFATKLARENGWSARHAKRVIEEYKRFCYLAVTTGQEVTPSDAVDQAWHLHLTYTRDYWERFCPDILGTTLHHCPTSGGATEQHRFFAQYAETLKSYQHAFGEVPPADIWPGAARRLIDDPRARRVHPRDAFILRRSHAALLLLAAGIAAIFAFLW